MSNAVGAPTRPGSKAATLLALQAAGFRVPEFAVEPGEAPVLADRLAGIGREAQGQSYPPPQTETPVRSLTIASPAGRPSAPSCVETIVLNALTTRARGNCRATSSLEVVLSSANWGSSPPLPG